MGVLSSKVFAHMRGEIIIHYIFEVNLIEIVGPWMEHREALMLDALLAELRNIVFQEFKVCFVGRDWICKIILDDFFLSVADESTDSFDARATLKILSFNLEVKETCHLVVILDTDCLQDSHENLLETFKIPILVDASVSYT